MRVSSSLVIWVFVFSALVSSPEVARAYSTKNLAPAARGCISRVDLATATAVIERFHYRSKNGTIEETRALGTALLWMEHLNGGRPLKEAVWNSGSPYPIHFRPGFGVSRRTPAEIQITRNGGKNYGENIAQIVHEIGHSVGWGGAYEEYRRFMGGNRCIVTSYSATKFNEQFAEVFAAFVTYPKLMKSNNSRGCKMAYEFFEKHLFARGSLAQKCIEHVPVKLEELVVDADARIGDQLQGLCMQFKERVHSVQAAVDAKINYREHPSTLPAQILAGGETAWGKHATPSRDGRLRLAVGNVIKSAVETFRKAKVGGSGVRFRGTAEDFVTSIRSKLATVSRGCAIQYKNSLGRIVTIDLNQAVSRLDKIAFDPYLCPEKRWGASGAELQTCRDGDRDGSWYSAEQSMRNTMGKLDDKGLALLRSDRPITLAMLRDPSLIDLGAQSPINLGTGRAPILSLEANFASPRFVTLLSGGN